MSETSNNSEEKIKRRSESYRLVVYRSEDFQEVRSFQLTMGNIYVLSSMLILVICGILFSLMAFTPLKRLIPGFGKMESNQEFLELVEGVDEINQQMEEQELYLSGLRTMLANSQSSEEGATFPGGSSTPPLTSRQETPIPVTESSYLNNRKTNSTDVNGNWPEILDAKLFNPVSGIISSEFDPSIKHFGVDILAPAQSPVISIMDGFVFSSGWDLETGYTIGIQHDGNVLSFYKHNSQLLKEKGTFVEAGEAVAIIGNTGTLSTGPHLHFELWHNGKPINPKDILNFNQ